MYAEIIGAEDAAALFQRYDQARGQWVSDVVIRCPHCTQTVQPAPEADKTGTTRLTCAHCGEIFARGEGEREGVVKLSAFITACRKAQVTADEMPRPALEALFQLIDADGDGCVSYEEFHRFMQHAGIVGITNGVPTNLPPGPPVRPATAPPAPRRTTVARTPRPGLSAPRNPNPAVRRSPRAAAHSQPRSANNRRVGGAGRRDAGVPMSAALSARLRSSGVASPRRRSPRGARSPREVKQGATVAAELQAYLADLKELLAAGMITSEEFAEFSLRKAEAATAAD